MGLVAHCMTAATDLLPDSGIVSAVGTPVQGRHCDAFELHQLAVVGDVPQVHVRVHKLVGLHLPVME